MFFWIISKIEVFISGPTTMAERSKAVDCLLELRVRTPSGAWISVSCECYVWSGRDLCVEPITRAWETYRLCCVIVCDLETSKMRRQLSALGCFAWQKERERERFFRIDNNYICDTRNSYFEGPHAINHTVQPGYDISDNKFANI